MKAIAAKCPALKSLNVQGCDALTHESMKAISAPCLVPENLREAWAEHKRNVVSEDGTKIDFGACYDWVTNKWSYKYFTVPQLAEVTDAFVVSLLSAKVTSINLAWCGITDVCVKAIAENCPALELLSIQGCRALGHESITAIPARCLVPESLREAWEEHKHNIVSEDGIDFGFRYDWDTDVWGF
ncbi:MAG: hypothetical protein AAFV01_17805, partial [Bacteroidota bacterium]